MRLEIYFILLNNVLLILFIFFPIISYFIFQKVNAQKSIKEPNTYTLAVHWSLKSHPFDFSKLIPSFHNCLKKDQILFAKKVRIEAKENLKKL